MSTSTSTTEIECAVYKSLKKDETYIFIPTSESLSDLPEELIKVLGQAELVMTLKLTTGKKLARCNATEVMQSIDKKGFYLQLPLKPHLVAVPSYKEKLSEKDIL